MMLADFCEYFYDLIKKLLGCSFHYRYLYWGESPLSFSACLSLTEAFELLLDSGADIYATDSNGNNVLHMMVIHNNKVRRHTVVEAGMCVSNQ